MEGDADFAAESNCAAELALDSRTNFLCSPRLVGAGRDLVVGVLISVSSKASRNVVS